MDTNEQELRDRREALLCAVNAQDWEKVNSIMHPSFSSKGILGIEFPRGFMIGLARAAVAVNRDFREALQIEHIVMQAERAEVTVKLTDSFKALGLFLNESAHRSKEIWKKIEGTWMMLSEEPAEAE